MCIIFKQSPFMLLSLMKQHLNYMVNNTAITNLARSQSGTLSTICKECVLKRLFHHTSITKTSTGSQKFGGGYMAQHDSLFH